MFNTGVKFLNRIAAGYSMKRKLMLTPIAALIFFTITALFIIAPLLIERTLNIQAFLFNPWNLVISILIIAPGVFYMLWSVFEFLKVKGTPVPFNPPPVLIAKGPYKYSRNPMTSGLFLLMFGLGILLGSILLSFVFVPLYALFHYFLLKNVEEPELEMRLGESYKEYKSRVPMFFPWKKIKTNLQAS
jgi:protein-S-isoprenylcysteine O-methyltransferase Ste14